MNHCTEQTDRAGKNGTITRLAVSGVLIVSVMFVYLQTGGYQFILYDDDSYILLNQAVKSGFSADSVKWAFTAFYASNWHPLTWISHILDVQIFGLNPGAHHLVSVALHAVNSCLLFLLLNRITGAVWKSATVAALFALHPLHVESVAWIAERKDVLSTLFWMMTCLLLCTIH